MDKIPETLQYMYDPNCFPENFLTTTEVPSKLIKQLKINHSQIQLQICMLKANRSLLQKSHRTQTNLWRLHQLSKIWIL